MLTYCTAFFILYMYLYKLHAIFSYKIVLQNHFTFYLLYVIIFCNVLKYNTYISLVERTSAIRCIVLNL